MGEVLILRTLNGQKITDEMVKSWFDDNEMFVTKKIFSHDRSSIEVSFIDEERAEMMSDLLNTCFGHFIEISRPETLIPFDNQSINEEQQSSAGSISSKRSPFSHRLGKFDNSTKQQNKFQLAVGRGRALNADFLHQNPHENNDDDDENSTIKTGRDSPVSTITTSSSFGFGRANLRQ